MHADDGRSLHAHLGLHGSVRLAAPGAGRGRHVLRTAAGDAVIRGRLEVVPAARLRLALGPDLLRDFDEAEFLRRARLVDRPVGEMLLDQRVVAGAGNIVKSEALWECRIDPFALVSSLDDDRLLRAGRGGRAACCATGSLPAAACPPASTGPRGRPCPRCGTPIRSAPQGEQRRTT